MTGKLPKTIIVAMALMRQGDGFLLQLRDGDPKIGAAGKVGCFGGKVEPDEPLITAVCREIAEETTVKLNPADGKHLGAVVVGFLAGRAARG